MRFKIDWASLIAGSKFTVFALFYFVFGGLIFGGAYFRNFTVYNRVNNIIVVIMQIRCFLLSLLQFLPTKKFPS